MRLGLEGFLEVVFILKEERERNCSSSCVEYLKPSTSGSASKICATIVDLESAGILYVFVNNRMISEINLRKHKV